MTDLGQMLSIFLYIYLTIGLVLTTFMRITGEDAYDFIGQPFRHVLCIFLFTIIGPAYILYGIIDEQVRELWLRVRLK
jgi:hypothetical protein